MLSLPIGSTKHDCGDDDGVVLLVDAGYVNTYEIDTTGR